MAWLQAPPAGARRRTAWFGALTAGLFLAAGSMAWPAVAEARAHAPRFEPQRPTRVLVLGDSVMKGAEAAVVAALPGREVVFDAEVNRSTGAGADIVASRGGDWDVAIVLLGHNDGGSPGTYQPAVRRILDGLGDAPYVSWLKIHEVRPYYPGVNQFLESLKAEYPNLHTGDWNAVAAAHPEALSSDGLHLNGSGAELMAGVVASEVATAEAEWEAELRRLATTTTTAPPTTTTAPPTTTSTSTSTSTTTDPPTTTAPASVPSDETMTATVTPAESPSPQPDDRRGPLAVSGGAAMLVVAGAAWGLRQRRSRG